MRNHVFCGVRNDSAAVFWACYLLAMNYEEQTRVREEVTAFRPKRIDGPTTSELAAVAQRALGGFASLSAGSSNNSGRQWTGRNLRRKNWRIWPRASLGAKDRAVFNFGSAAAKAANGSVTRDIAATACAAADPMSASTLLRIDRERTIEKLARLGQIVRERTFVKPSRPLKTEVQRVGVRGLFPARRASVVRLSVTPSAKYSCSGSPLIFANGNTTIERRTARSPAVDGWPLFALTGRRSRREADIADRRWTSHLGGSSRLHPAGLQVRPISRPFGFARQYPGIRSG